MRPDAKVEKVYLYPKPINFRKSIDGLAALVELEIKVAMFDPVLFVSLNKPRSLLDDLIDTDIAPIEAELQALQIAPAATEKKQKPKRTALPAEFPRA